VFDDDFKNSIYRWTAGHVGVVESFLRYLVPLHGDQIRAGITFTLEQFYSENPTWGSVLKSLRESLAGRGFPNPAQIQEEASTFRALLGTGYIDVMGNDETEETGLTRCHKRGWLHTIMTDSGVRYHFPSPIHKSCVSWFLRPTDTIIPYATPYELAVATVKGFKRSQLTDSIRRVGGGLQDKATEAQYQAEFNRSLHSLIDGSVVMTPEFASAARARAGRIDFFVHGKKWGIECTREGDRLKDHISRFGAGGAYGKWLQSSDMEDYILLDFRTTVPIKKHSEYKNLFHVVFVDNHTQVSILDNKLQGQTTFALMENTSY